jgi:cytolysin-activating lysine-acyltransferase
MAHAAEVFTFLHSAIHLAAHSPLHSRWSIADCYRLFLPPIHLGQIVWLTHEQRILGFASFALLSEEVEAGFAAKTRPLLPADWRSGDRLWLVDCIAPFGHGDRTARLLRRRLRADGHRGKEIAFRRTYPDGSSRVARSML